MMSMKKSHVIVSLERKINSSKEDSYKDFDVEEEKEFQPAKSKVTQMRTPARHSSSGNMEVCVVKPGSVMIPERSRRLCLAVVP